MSNDLYFYNEIQRVKREQYEETPTKWVSVSEVHKCIELLPAKREEMKRKMLLDLEAFYRNRRILLIFRWPHPNPRVAAENALKDRKRNLPPEFYSAWNSYVEKQRISTSLRSSLEENCVGGECNVSLRDYYEVKSCAYGQSLA